MSVTCRLVEGSAEKAKPGDMFWITFGSGHCVDHNPPCTRHLVVVLPNGNWWDIDSRASNCTMPKDQVHRCWVRHGEPPTVTVDKKGVTCKAGAGSIQSGEYHGYLKKGVLS